MLKNLLLDYLGKAKLKYSIYIKDLNTKDLCCINENEIVPSASIIKLYIMGAVLELASKKNIDLNQRISITKEEKVPFSIISLLDDNSYTINDLIMLMIIQSDNTATNKLIDIIGIKSINEFSEKSGFKNTTLQRKMMDFSSRIDGKENLTNVCDVAIFLEMIYRGELINKDFSEFTVNFLKEQLDNSMMRINLPDELIIAHKTGDLEYLKHDAGIVYTSSKDYIFIMFTWDAVSDNYARNIIGNISKITYDYFMSGGKYHENH